MNTLGVDPEIDPWRTHGNGNLGNNGLEQHNGGSGSLGGLVSDPLLASNGTGTTSTFADILGGDPAPSATKEDLTTRLFGNESSENVLLKPDSVWTDGGTTATAKNEGTTLNGAHAEGGILEQTQTKDSTNEQDLADWVSSVRKSYNPSKTDIITIEEIPEREGLLFKHTNYKVTHLIVLPNSEHASTDRSVVRRYSDFVWLQEVLLKRYPFRLIPELPPKKIGSQNLDPIFLLQRRKGLVTFINLIVNHPVLAKDDLLLTFLTVPTDLSNWRKQTRDNYDTTDEFMDRKIAQSFMKLWKKDIAEQWNSAANSINRTIEIWHRISVLIQRQEKRLNLINQEKLTMARLINDFSEMTPVLYPKEDNETILDINNNLSIIRQNVTEAEKINKQHINGSVVELHPKLRRFIDILASLKNLFERYKIMGTNNVAQLQGHIGINMGKLEAMKGKPDASGTEYDKIRLCIQRDKRSIMEQLNRAWLIRECILHEFTIFQESQFLISTCFKTWVRINSDYTALNMNEWEKLGNQIENMPTSRD
ncbi:Mvp1p KNAG_0I01700 [Huiozyma naganishii CBS 8797]|uniref:Sorting nexin MVP1 n=1 Tax=Huiozyma naganishii (strain ATCC MYA-139 / BCRC 22969 / CBS 8797 / KCTC 17520 / NBRC 10181 / NCYC 3082 / Yp74L-3) TaxID=1071383 RepID=J7RAQ2_HUIN7|nr:hypothetical protein KNAG_0I01700 [Kazachstania naganishii CBS 8797]CCK71955.1 hypothetical protein KNAG_0I01700 [Kazachstania naganishii CBS 8797]